VVDLGVEVPSTHADFAAGGVAATPKETITLLQNDALQACVPTNVLGYAQPTDGDQAQGFAVNSTHNEWVTSEMHFGQQISKTSPALTSSVQSGAAAEAPS
jgi:hypothetical protein